MDRFAATPDRHRGRLAESARHRLGLSPQRCAGDADDRACLCVEAGQLQFHFLPRRPAVHPTSGAGGRANGWCPRLAQVPYDHISSAGTDNVFPARGEFGLCRVRHVWDDPGVDAGRTRESDGDACGEGLSRRGGQPGYRVLVRPIGGFDDRCNWPDSVAVSLSWAAAARRESAAGILSPMSCCCLGAILVRRTIVAGFCWRNARLGGDRQRRPLGSARQRRASVFTLGFWPVPYRACS